MKYFVYILILQCSILIVATENEDKTLENFINSKLIRILDLQGILGALELNATYKDIKTLNIGRKSHDTSSDLNLWQQPDFNINNQQAQPDFNVNNQRAQPDFNVNNQRAQPDFKVNYKKPQSDFSVNNQRAPPDYHVNNQMHAEKAWSTQETTTAIKQLKAQIENLQVSVLNLKNLVSSTENKASSCSADKSWERIHLINVPGLAAFRVLCDACDAGSGWIVIQRRFDGSLDFYRDWNAYRFGFGYYESEFFMGLEYIHRLTISRPHELYIELIDFENRLYFSRYDDFLIGSVEEKFMLKSLGTYSGNAGDALRYNLYDKFSTYDSDNDGWFRGNCANFYESGWWFNSDANSNLNGRYLKSGERNIKGVWWYTLRGYGSLKSVRMLIRPKYTLI